MMGYHKTNLTIGQQTIFLKSHTQFNRATNKRETVYLGHHNKESKICTETITNHLALFGWTCATLTEERHRKNTN
jgi:hypothetical protein